MQKSWLNVLLVVISVAVTAVAAEFLVRWLDKGGEIASAARHLDEIPLAPGVERAWFYETPPPLPNRKEVPEAWRELVRDVEKSGITEGTRRADMFKAWNSAASRCTFPKSLRPAAKDSTSRGNRPASKWR